LENFLLNQENPKFFKGIPVPRLIISGEESGLTYFGWKALQGDLPYSHQFRNFLRVIKKGLVGIGDFK